MVETAIHERRNDECRVWAELGRIEKSMADFRDTEIGLRELALIKKLHPSQQFSREDQLRGEIGQFRRAALGLK